MGGHLEGAEVKLDFSKLEHMLEEKETPFGPRRHPSTQLRALLAHYRHRQKEQGVDFDEDGNDRRGSGSRRFSFGLVPRSRRDRADETPYVALRYYGPPPDEIMDRE